MVAGAPSPTQPAALATVVRSPLSVLPPMPRSRVDGNVLGFAPETAGAETGLPTVLRSPEVVHYTPAGWRAIANVAGRDLTRVRTDVVAAPPRSCAQRLCERVAPACARRIWGKLDHLLWWEAAILLRKFLVVVITTQVADASTQLVAIMLLFFVALQAQLYFTPYKEGLPNRLEAIGLVAVQVTAMTSCILLSESSSTGATTSSTLAKAAAGTWSQDATFQLAVTAFLFAINGAAILRFVVILGWLCSKRARPKFDAVLSFGRRLRAAGGSGAVHAKLQAVSALQQAGATRAARRVTAQVVPKPPPVAGAAAAVTPQELRKLRRWS
jgi:hypothetical protein